MKIIVQDFPLKPIKMVCHICGNQIFTDERGIKFCPSCNYPRIKYFLHYASRYTYEILRKYIKQYPERSSIVVIVEPMNEKTLGKCEIHYSEKNKCVLKINGKYISFASHTLKSVEGRLLYTYVFLHEIFHFLYSITQAKNNINKGDTDSFNEEIWVRKKVYELLRLKYKSDVVYEIILSVIKKISSGTDFEMSDFDIRFLSGKSST